MTIIIIDRQKHNKGQIYKVQINGKTIEILFLFHALGRIKKWKLSELKVVETLLLPEEVIRGHGERFIAHKRYGSHLVRAVYNYENELPVLITVYFPFVERYYEGGGIYEDKILR